MKIPTLMIVLAAGLAPAQQADTFNARITGTNGDRGKCTIEVVVDGVAEVEVYGSQGSMNTVSGARATWRRMDCNMSLPANPGEFKFSPQTGRGKQYLVREPAQNRGAALVRIEDPAGGSAGYKFDLEWRGTGGASAGNNSSSIFNRVPPGGGSLSGGTGNGSVAGWNRQVNFNGRGDGYYRSFRSTDDLLTDAQVTVDRSGRVEVVLTTTRRERIALNGRLVLADKDRLVADMLGGTIQGAMEILLDSRDRVQELAMTGVGRNRFELRWQPR